jgi:RHS repeat-associated protein
MLLGNGQWEQARFNSRLQPVFLGLGAVRTTDPAALNGNDSNLLLLSFQYKDNAGDPARNNGNVSHQSIQVKATATAPALSLTQSYLYDPVNRLSSASESGGINPWTQSNGYDRFGNRWASSGAEVGGYPTWVPQSQSEFNAANNRLVTSPSVYDEVGNLKADKVSRLFKYDAENKQVEFNPNVGSQPVTNYFYDGDGRRVKKSENGGTAVTVYVYNVQGQLAAEYTTKAVTGSGTSYLTTDHLGSTRIVTDAAGNAKTRHDYLPFGEEISLLSTNYGNRLAIPGYTSTILDGPTQKFTAKERDSESGLDYFGARYHSAAQGRFTSVDPSRMSARITNPQSFNRYSYTLNRPLVAIDPDGLATILVAVGKGQKPGATITLFNKRGEVAVSGGRYSEYGGLASGVGGRDRSKQKADTPFGVYRFGGVKGGTSQHRRGTGYGTGKVRLVETAGEVVAAGRNGILLHGGGTSALLVPDPYAPFQPLIRTEGCVRMCNADVNSLITAILTVGDHAKAEFFEPMPGGPAAEDGVKKRLSASRCEGQGAEGLRWRSFSAL